MVLCACRYVCVLRCLCMCALCVCVCSALIQKNPAVLRCLACWCIVRDAFHATLLSLLPCLAAATPSPTLLSDVLWRALLYSLHGHVPYPVPASGHAFLMLDACLPATPFARLCPVACRGTITPHPTTPLLLLIWRSSFAPHLPTSTPPPPLYLLTLLLNPSCPT